MNFTTVKFLYRISDILGSNKNGDNIFTHTSWVATRMVTIYSRTHIIVFLNDMYDYVVRVFTFHGLFA